MTVLPRTSHSRTSSETASPPCPRSRQPWARFFGGVRDERGGTSSVEALLLIPSMVLLIGLVVAAGATMSASLAVEGAAAAAARAASLERGPGPAREVAIEIAAARLSDRCAEPSVRVDVPAVSVGQPSTVSTTVGCRITYSDLLIPLPGGRAFTAEGTSPVDTFRSR